MVEEDTLRLKNEASINDISLMKLTFLTPWKSDSFIKSMLPYGDLRLIPKTNTQNKYISGGRESIVSRVLVLYTPDQVLIPVITYHSMNPLEIIFL